MTTGEPKITTEMIGLDEAKDILDNRNSSNRSLSRKTVSQYARAMLADEWSFIGDPIRFDRDGKLLDGQHRLAAMIESGCPQTFVIVRNLESTTQKRMDAGRKRNAADQLRIDGMANPTIAASIGRLVMHWQAGDLPGFNIKYSTSEVVDFVECNLDRIEAATTHAKALYRAICTSQAVSGASYVMAREVADEKLADEFMNLLVSGAGLTVGSPILLLRNKLAFIASSGKRPERQELVYFYARSWNGWRRNEVLNKLQLPAAGTLSTAHMRMHP